ncbi:MAG: alpha/beta fold hydrolase [Robiginitomaculum sp.]|nr:alpha/beta fold hydrolase [Robiginitomaculum sp.]
MAQNNKIYDDEQDLVDSIYAVAMEPERFRELVDIWQERITQSPSSAKLLARHAERAETILSVMQSNEDALPIPLREKLNAEPQAMLALTVDGIIEAFNPAAETLFEIAEGDRISKLPFTGASINIILREIRLTAQRDFGDDAHAPSLFRMERKRDNKPLLIALSAWKTAGGRKFVLLKTADFVWPDYLSPLVKKAFGLTDAEANVVKYLVEGKNFEEIAQIRGTAADTVRVQIRSIYAKTSTNSKSEFIRMAIGLTTLQLVNKDVLTGALQRPASQDSQAYPLPEHRRLLSLPDGRIMDYAIFGPDDGKPCLFFHNQYYGDVWPAELARYAAQKGFRILAPARPFYARSSPYPKGVKSYEQHAEDINYLMEKLGIAQALHIAQTNGGMFSLAFADKFPQKTRALICIAPMLPVLSPEDWENMPKTAKFFSSIIRNHPQMLKFVVNAGMLYHSRVGSRRFLETIIAHTNPDQDVIKDESNADAIIQGFQYIAENGKAALYHDYRDLPENPLQWLQNLQCKLYAIIGSHENNSRAMRADRLRDVGVNIKKVMAKGGGDMLFFSHPKLIVDTMIEAWESA